MKKGYEIGGKNFKVHLDGYNLMPFFKGEVKESPRKEFLYWSDDGDLMAIRVFSNGRSRSWSSNRARSQNAARRLARSVHQAARPQSVQSARRSVRARDRTSILLRRWMVHRAFLIVPAQAIAAKWLESFKEFPPRAKAASFTLSEVMEKIMAAAKQN